MSAGPTAAYKWCALFCLFAFALMGAGCQSETPQAGAEVARPVKALAVQSGQAEEVTRYPGKVMAFQRVDLSFRVAGRLIHLPVVEGQRVARGQVLARLDPRDYRIRRDKAKAAYEQARHNHARYRNLVGSKAVSQAAFDSALATYQTTKAVYEEAEAALRDTWLRAPFAGVVAKRFVENHQDIKEKVRVLSLQDLDRLKVEAQIPERDVLNLKPSPGLKLSVLLDALPGRELPARVSELSAQADDISQTYTLQAVFQQPQGQHVLPGMTAELLVRRRSPGGQGMFRVPLAAVFVDAAGKNTVWKIDPKQMKVQKAEVVLKGLDHGQAVITSGLKPGETIAAAGVHELRQGMRVRLMDVSSGEGPK